MSEFAVPQTEAKDTVRHDGDGSPDEPGEGTGDKRQRSTIAFSYEDLDTALQLVRRLHDERGGRCALDQLAGTLQQKTTSGTFRNRVSAARLFGFVTTGRDGIALTDLGARALDDASAPAAKVEAFLRVPLYAALYERFKGRTLPPAKAGLESTIQDLGVGEKQVPTARWKFEKSAQSAGFFDSGRDRLVEPTTAKVDAGSAGATGGSTDDRGTKDPEARAVSQHPLILGLLEALPEPSEGFAEDDRELWLEAARMNFSLIYGRTDRRQERADTQTHAGSTNGA